jgi:hypothetical protein
MKFKLVEKLYYTDEKGQFQIFEFDEKWNVYKVRDDGLLNFKKVCNSLDEAKNFVADYKE